MKNDRLREDKDNIHDLGDIIDAHSERKLYADDEIDSLEEDVEVHENIDVEEALTFPHPKHKKTKNSELLGAPHIEDVDDEWRYQGAEMQPSDYEGHYSDAVDTYATDDLDEVVEERVHHMGDLTSDELTEEQPTEIMPNKFTPSDV